METKKRKIAVPFPIARINTILATSKNIYSKKSRPEGKIFRGTHYPAKKKNELIDDYDNEDNFENNYGQTYQTQIKSFYTQKNEKITNGFLSSSDRFDNTKTKEDQYRPGPGDYNNFEINSIADKVLKNKRTKTNDNSKKEKKWAYIVYTDGPGPGLYYPQKQYHNLKIMSSFFASETKKGKFYENYNDSNPGPGQYFKLKQELTSSPKKNKKFPNFFFRDRYEKKENPFKKFKIDYGDSMNYQYKLISKKGKLQNLKIYSSLPNNHQNPKDLKDYYLVNTYPKMRKEIIIEHYSYSHPKKQDIFYLSSPRWSHNIYTSPFKVPGPAYYSPYPN